MGRCRVAAESRRRTALVCLGARCIVEVGTTSAVGSGRRCALRRENAAVFVTGPTVVIAAAAFSFGTWCIPEVLPTPLVIAQCYDT